MIDIHINPQQLHSFKGGIKLNQHKTDSLDNPLAVATIPDKLYMSLRINRGNVAKAIVEIGNKVLKGQIIATPDTDNGCYIHASSSGTITNISTRATASPDANAATVIEITTDKLDKWVTLTPAKDVLQAIKEAGLVGMGGAGFPTHLKYASADISTLIINAAECEPYISCDEQLMLNYPHELLDGILLMLQAAAAKQAILALEDQTGGIKAKFEELISARNIHNVCVIKVPTIYPAGGEKQLIKVLTGKEVPAGGLPLHLGIIVQNVATVKALADFYHQGKPLIERIITIAGDGVAKPQNFSALIGTPLHHLLQQAQLIKEKTTRVVIGGPMMGYAMPSYDIGIDKTSNCILALSQANTKLHGDTLPCIRCGECVNVCPANLLPQQLHWYIQGDNLEKAREHHLFDCIECGACAWVCPSQIKLVDYYRYAKSEIKYLDFKRNKADIAQARHAQREVRLAQLKAERVATRKKTRRRSRDPEKMQLDLQATLARVKQAKADKNDST
ncbi:MAG: electron transport complex subunit RsxC [Proteobacteria bacterium]|nr:electron transport complex subunit RsxC [Pseudomonadota bacterium]